MLEWKREGRFVGFNDAKDYWGTTDLVLALWDHAQCRGWNLYRKTRRGAKWFAAAGVESLAWKPEQAHRWAERLHRS